MSTDFKIFLYTDGIEGTLHQQGFDVSASSADSGRFLLSSALIVLRRKTDPGAKMLGGLEHGYVHSDFRDDANSGVGLDTL